MSEGEEP